jgi:hypothetical protein
MGELVTLATSCLAQSPIVAPRYHGLAAQEVSPSGTQALTDAPRTEGLRPANRFRPEAMTES